MYINDEITEYIINIKTNEIDRHFYCNLNSTENYKFININKKDVCIKNDKYEILKNGLYSLKRYIFLENNKYQYKKLEKVLTFNDEKFFQKDIIECSYYNNSKENIIEGAVVFINENIIKIKDIIIPINLVISVKLITPQYTNIFSLSEDNYNILYEYQKSIRNREYLSNIIFNISKISIVVDLIMMITFLIKLKNKISTSLILIIFIITGIFIISFLVGGVMYPYNKSKSYILNIDD